MLRGKRVMLASDLAEVYGVETRALNQAVKRNMAKFPADFLFQLTEDEAEACARFKITNCDLEARSEHQVSTSGCAEEPNGRDPPAAQTLTWNRTCYALL